MKVVVFGSTGGTGRQLVEQALAAGHDVVAFARNPAALGALRNRAPSSGAKLEMIQGNVLDPARVREALGRGEVVASCLGATAHTPATICSDGARILLEGMRQLNRRRFACVSAYGAGETRSRGPYARLLRVMLRKLMDDKDRMEEIVRASGMEWVIARPPILTNGPLTRRYRESPDLALGWLPRISRADTAHFLLRQLETAQHAGLAVTISH